MGALHPLHLSARLHALTCVAFASAFAGFESAAWAASPPQLAPLIERSPGPSGATLFEEIPPAKSGITIPNTYADPRFYGDRFSEFTLGAIGTGITVGDFDRDGKPDLFIVAKTEASRLYRNRGDGTFEDVTARAGLDDPEPAVWKQGASFADVNNDGWPDLYLCRYDAPNRLWINQGNGTFREEAESRGAAIKDASGMAVFGDYDRDGDLDLYLVTNLLSATAAPEAQPDRLLRNDGSGHFTDVTQAAGIRGPGFGHSALWWDYDEDGWPDLYVANDFAGVDSFYRNNRDGTFTDVLTEAFPYVSYSSMGSDLVDANNDGHLGLFVAEMSALGRERDQRTMAESRAQLNRAPGQSAPRQVMRNVLFLADGSSRLREAACLAGLEATDWTWSPRWEDLDTDGWPDLFVTNGMVIELHNADLHARIRSAESTEARLGIMKAMPRLDERNLAFRNRGNLTFEDSTAAWGLEHVGVSFGCALFDLEGDGDLDLVYSNFKDGPRLFRNRGAEGNRLVVRALTANGKREALGAVVRVTASGRTQTRAITAARGYLSTSEPAAFFGLGSADGADEIRVTWPDGRETRLTGIRANQTVVLAEPASSAFPASVAPRLFQIAPAALSTAGNIRPPPEEPQQPALLPFRLNRRGPALAAGDLSGDGRPELVVGGAAGAPLSIQFFDIASNTWSALDLQLPASNLADGPVLIHDFDGDGRRDLLVTRGGMNGAPGTPAYRPLLLLASETGSLVPAPEGFWPASLNLPLGAVVAADFDRDGDLDLFVGCRALPRRYPQAGASRLLRNDGKGHFEDVTSPFAATGFGSAPVTAARWSDVDGDGWLDLLVAAEGEPVRCWINQQGRGFSEETERLGFLSGGRGLWTTLQAGDFNGDGRLDYAVGNLGLNTPYRADSTHPYVLLSGNLRGNGTPVILESVQDAGRLWPLRARSEIAAALPELLRKLPTTDAFAARSVEDWLPADRLAAAQRMEVNQLANGFFLSQADGTFKFQPAPRLAQLSPWQALQVSDFDGDGHLDVLTVEGSRHLLPAMGPAEGGLGALLRGDGRGGFSVESASLSGWRVPGEAEAMVRMEAGTDKQPSFWINRHGETSLTATLHGDAWLILDARHVPDVQLEGARIQLEGESTLLWEASRSDGPLSQSEAVFLVRIRSSTTPGKLTVHWANGTQTLLKVAPGQRRLEIKGP